MLQTKDVLEGQLFTAQQMTADLELKCQAQMEELEGAAKRTSLAEQQRQDFEKRCEALQQSLHVALAEHQKADQVRLPKHAYFTALPKHKSALHLSSIQTNSLLLHGMTFAHMNQTWP